MLPGTGRVSAGRRLRPVLTSRTRVGTAFADVTRLRTWTNAPVATRRTIDVADNRASLRRSITRETLTPHEHYRVVQKIAVLAAVVVAGFAVVARLTLITVLAVLLALIVVVGVRRLGVFGCLLRVVL